MTGMTRITLDNFLREELQAMRPAGQNHHALASGYCAEYVCCNARRVRACLESAIGRRCPTKDVIVLAVVTVTGSGVNPTHHSSALTCLLFVFLLVGVAGVGAIIL